MSVKLCTVADDLVHLIDIPLEQAQVRYSLVSARGMSIIYVSEDDIDRARATLERFGSFREVDDGR